MRVLIQTRFSYFGVSGWKSDYSQDKELFFDEKRLEARFFLFEKITLPSLAAQLDDDFNFHILSSSELPKKYKERLLDNVHAALGKERVVIEFGTPGKNAGRFMRKMVWDAYSKDELLAQSVLDDDDAFAKDFVRICRETSSEIAQSFDSDLTYTVLSFPAGFQYYIQAPKTQSFQEHRERWINLGLTWISKADTSKNVLLTRHKVVNRHHPVKTAFGAQPLYIRTLHEQNDSGKRDWNEDETLQTDLFSNVQAHFPFVTDEWHEIVTKGYAKLIEAKKS